MRPLSRKGERFAVIEIKMKQYIDETAKDLGNGTVVGVRDGSFKYDFGTPAWVLENKSRSQIIMGNVLLP